MADLVQDLTGECFGAIARLRELDGPVPSPEMVHARIRGFIEALKERARIRGIPDKDTQDIVYAIVALTDEIALNTPEPLRSYWMSQPLQLHYFGENVAGEGFFARLQSLLGDGRRIEVLRVITFACCSDSRASTAFPVATSNCCESRMACAISSNEHGSAGLAFPRRRTARRTARAAGEQQPAAVGVAGRFRPGAGRFRRPSPVVRWAGRRRLFAGRKTSALEVTPCSSTYLVAFSVHWCGRRHWYFTAFRCCSGQRSSPLSSSF